MKIKFHQFHIVTLRPWPIINSLIAWNLVISIAHSFESTNNYLITFNLIFTSIIAKIWWSNIFKETTYQGFHQIKVINGLKIGIILFIVSEILFFTSFFWAYFHSRIRPNIEIGIIWPPTYIKPFDPINVPLLNTIILISSGISITWRHHSINKNKLSASKIRIIITCILGLLFRVLQAIEYLQSPFSISDSTYGSTFFLATGFHGIHIIIGTTFLLVCLNQINNKKISITHLVGFEIASWYWHFVDVVWLFLYLSIYWWGS